MDVQEAVSEFLFAKLTRSPYTQRGYKRRLLVFVAWCEEQGLQLQQLSARHIRMFLETVAKRPGYKGGTLKASTLRIYALTIKVFLAWAAREPDFEDFISPKVSARIELPKSDQEVIETFTKEELDALFRAAEKQPELLAVRDKAILCVLVDTGIRAAELCGLTLDCTWLDADDSYLKVKGKGRKEREVPLGRTSRIALRRYITRYRKPAVRGEQRVFLSRVGSPLTSRGLDQMIRRLGGAAQVRGAHPHRFRHNFACQYLLSGGDVYKLSRLLGHHSTVVTERYLRAVRSRQVRDGKSVLDQLKSSQ